MKLKESDGTWFDYDDETKFKLRFHPDPPGNWLKVLETILEDWEGIVDSQDAPVKCNRKGIIAFLCTKEGRVAASWMMLKMSNMHEFLDMDLLKKKLESLSNGVLTSQTQPEKDVQNV